MVTIQQVGIGFDSPKVKRDLISSIINFVYELPHKMPNNLTLRMLGNYEILGKPQNWVEIEPSAQSPLQKYSFGHSSQKLRKTR